MTIDVNLAYAKTRHFRIGILAGFPRSAAAHWAIEESWRDAGRYVFARYPDGTVAVTSTRNYPGHTCSLRKKT